MGMTCQTLRLERRGPAAWIWMNRPDVHNAFDETLITDLTAAFAAVDADRNVRVIVLAGEGKSFSADADLNWMRQQGIAAFEDDRGSGGTQRLPRQTSPCLDGYITLMRKPRMNLGGRDVQEDPNREPR
jgi:enoyl-CoA hydratase/carnithine racemase